MEAIQWFDWGEVERQYGQNLPHFEQSGAVYFITFRLWDSIPSEILWKLQAERDEWLRQNPPPHDADAERELRTIYSLPLERYLDEGHGKCVLRDPGIRDELVDIMLRFDGETYKVGDYVAMPNHVHVLLWTGGQASMEKVCWRWKNRSATVINRALHKRGHVWQSEGFDHIVRSAIKLEKCRMYIQANPRYLKADDYTLGCGRLFDC